MTVFPHYLVLGFLWLITELTSPHWFTCFSLVGGYWKLTDGLHNIIIIIEINSMIYKGLLDYRLSLQLFRVVKHWATNYMINPLKYKYVYPGLHSTFNWYRYNIQYLNTNVGLTSYTGHRPGPVKWNYKNILLNTIKYGSYISYASQLNVIFAFKYIFLSPWLYFWQFSDLIVDKRRMCWAGFIVQHNQ